MAAEKLQNLNFRLHNQKTTTSTIFMLKKKEIKKKDYKTISYFLGTWLTEF